MYIVRMWEGLGNQMFQYAFARAIQHRTGQKVFLDADRTYKESFLLEEKHVERSYMLDNFNIRLKKIKVDELAAYDFLRQRTPLEKILFSLSQKGWWIVSFLQDTDAVYHKEFFRKKGNYYVFGWFQQEAYFKDIRNILLKEFTPKRKIKISGKLLSVLREENTVAVHVRRSDYLKLGHVCNSFYYTKAMCYIKKYVENPIYLVFSDDVEWVKNNVKIAGRAIYISEEYQFKDFEELIIMSKCKHQIIANSTFSWWGAWLNKNPNKIVIAPSKWFIGIQDNIVPDDWTII